MHSKGEEQDGLVGLVHVARIVDEFKISIYLSIVDHFSPSFAGKACTTYLWPRPRPTPK